MTSLFRFLGLEKKEAAQASPAETDAVRSIVARLESMEPEHARYVAAFAYVMGRVARADLHISEEETRTMERLVVEHGRLSEDEAIIVVQVAKTQGRLFGGTEDYLVTREFSKIAAGEQKLALLDCLYAVCSADRDVSVAEDNEIRQIAQELGLDHGQVIAVRSVYRDHLSVLKKPDPA